MTIRDHGKAARYIAQLDAARCNSEWQDVPELARKVEKHAPNRKCLALAAKSEAQIATSSSRPSTAVDSSETSRQQLSRLIPPLLSAIDAETQHLEDAFEAKTCLGWLHWILGEPALAASRLPRDFTATMNEFSGKSAQLGQWVQVCAIKGAYLKGHSQEMSSSLTEAADTYSSMLPYLNSIPSLASTSLQFRFWTERLLTRLCAAFMDIKPFGATIDLSTMLKMFRLWATFWKDTGIRKTTQSGENGTVTGTSRWQVWDAYYYTLSQILKRGLLYAPHASYQQPRLLDSPDGLTEEELLNSRLQQRAELKRVETNNEAILLEETRFPKATGRNEHVEQWIRGVIRNWRIMCGPTWQDEELGEGGKAAVARGVIDTLYRAATKTFHSTQILRHLFTVHASIAEFDLAFQAFDSYVEIVTRGKDRAQKSGEADDSMDNDDTILRTAAEAIKILCRFGSRKGAEKAQYISSKIQEWLKQDTPAALSETSAESSELSTQEILDPRTIAVAYRAMAISQANWARLTYDATLRSTLQTQATQWFRKALDPKYHDGGNPETLYAFALLLAEMRDITGALKIVKQVIGVSAQRTSIISANGSISEYDDHTTRARFLNERKLIPFWHLLALLLTTRSDFSTAARSCEAAFEQFKDSTVLFGIRENASQYRSEHLKGDGSAVSNETSQGIREKGLVDRMDGFEKEGIVQVKMTQLALVEVLDSPSAAVDMSDELLALYARLFGDPTASRVKPTPTPTPKPPKSAVGTIKGSIFSRMSTRKSLHSESSPGVPRPIPTASTRHSTRPSTAISTMGPPTIQVTDGDDAPVEENSHRQSPLSLRHKRHSERPAHKRTESHKLRKKSGETVRPKSDVFHAQTSSVVDNSAEPQGANQRATMPPPAERAGSVTPPNDENFPPPSKVHNPQHASQGDARQSAEVLPDSPTQPLRSIAHNRSHSEWPPPAGHPNQPPEQDIRLPAPFPGSQTDFSPGPSFPQVQERRQKVALLVSVWLFIAGLYTRGGIEEDAKGATDEAAKLVADFELEVSQQGSSAKNFAERGWGGGKSVEELWADVWAERGNLAQASSLPYEAQFCYERALSHFPDHASAIVGLSDILLDIHAGKIPPERPSPSLTDTTAPNPAEQPTPSTKTISVTQTLNGQAETRVASPASAAATPPATPEELNRLAARNRAYVLLDSLTKLGSGWDYAEAWYALARAYEQGGQGEKARECLWWCVELEDWRPLRAWEVLGLS